MTFTLAHLSDPHLAPLPRPMWRELAGKRALGYINWRRNRHRVHRREVLDALVADLHAQRPDHIAVTGDLTNIALPAEIDQAAQWLRGIGAPTDVTLVPGNHDAYMRDSLPRTAAAWGDYMCGDVIAAHHGFPFVRRRDALTLVGVSTAVPTAPFMATGELGDAQRAALEQTLYGLDAQNFRVLLIHHPLISGDGRRHARLTDTDKLQDVLRRYPVDLVLHGHDHRHAITWVDGPTSPIPVVGVASASVAPGGHREAAAYNLFAIARADDGWRVTMTTRGMREDGTVAEVRRESLR